jgi:hypothetical protein
VSNTLAWNWLGTAEGPTVAGYLDTGDRARFELAAPAFGVR